MPLLLLCRSKKASKRISVPLLQINDKSLGVLELWFLKHVSCAGSVRLEDVVPKRMTLKSLKSRSKVEKETLVTLAWCIQLEGFCLMFWAFSWAVLWTSRHEPDTTHNTPLADPLIHLETKFSRSLDLSSEVLEDSTYHGRRACLNLFSTCESVLRFFGPFSRPSLLW